jgi:hypothetical protein
MFSSRLPEPFTVAPAADSTRATDVPKNIRSEFTGLDSNSTVAS